jgi:hypothetical protein
MPGDYNSFAPNQNWQSLGAGGLYGYNNQGGAGTPVARGELDAVRIGIGRTPSAEYPDGYLGTIRSRRDDKLLDSIKSRVGQKQYQRGVHKGEKIGPDHYFWSMDFNPQSGLQRQMKIQYDKENQTFMVPRATILSEMAPPPHLVNDGKANMRSDAPVNIDERRAQRLSYLRPRWS